MEVKVGMDIEDEKNYGISHLVEHIVFRDQRVPYHDYLDYIKEEGGTYVNGYTTRYTTEYLTTIDSNKSYWITEVFAQMIFDKNVTNRDRSHILGGYGPAVTMSSVGLLVYLITFETII